MYMCMCVRKVLSWRKIRHLFYGGGLSSIFTMDEGGRSISSERRSCCPRIPRAGMDFFSVFKRADLKRAERKITFKIWKC